MENCYSLDRLPLRLFSRMEQLRKLNLEGCSRLAVLPPSIGCLVSLEDLDLSQCSSLLILHPSMSALRALQRLDVTNCGAATGAAFLERDGLYIEGTVIRP